MDFGRLPEAEDDMEFMFPEEVAEAQVIDVLKDRLLTERHTHRVEIDKYQSELAQLMAELQNAQLQVKEANEVISDYSKKYGDSSLTKKHKKRMSSIIIDDLMGLGDDDWVSKAVSARLTGDDSQDDSEDDDDSSSKSKSKKSKKKKKKKAKGLESDSDSSDESRESSCEPTMREGEPLPGGHLTADGGEAVSGSGEGQQSRGSVEADGSAEAGKSQAKMERLEEELKQEKARLLAKKEKLKRWEVDLREQTQAVVTSKLETIKNASAALDQMREMIASIGKGTVVSSSRSC